MITEAILQEATRRLVERFNPVRIILFGSQARGTADERSDVDLLVLFDGGSPDTETVTRMYAAMRGLGVPLDLVPMSADQFELHRQIIGTLAYPASREGRVLYQRAA